MTRAALAQELHRPSRRRFNTRRVEIKGLNDLFQADLVEMIPYADENDDFHYVMTVINCFSKYAYAIPVRRKNTTEMVQAMKKLFETTHPPRNFQTDQGSEWFNRGVGALLKKLKVNHYHSYSDKKASIIERFNRTLKTNMWRRFTAQGDYKWLKMLPDLIKKYNNTVHRTIRMKPSAVNKKNEKSVLAIINRTTYRKSGIGKGSAALKVKPKLKVGDRVRISKYKKIFDKGYLPNWTNEIFLVRAVRLTRPVTYLLKDIRGENIKGAFYEEELNKTKFPNVYLVERVLERKGNRVKVRWLGFDATHDSWINKKDII